MPPVVQYFVETLRGDAAIELFADHHRGGGRAVAEAMIKPLGTTHRGLGSAPATANFDRQRAILAAAAPEHREALETAAARLDTTLLGIERRDAADQTALKTHRDDVARQMAGTVVTRGAAQAYGGLDAPLGVVYQDRHG